MATAGTTVGAKAPAIKWKTNPFNGDFNPAMKTRQVIFLEKTKGHPNGKQFDLSEEHSTQIHQFFKTRSALFGKCCTIPIAFDATGTATEWANLISQHLTISLKQVQWSAHKQFGTLLAVNANIPTGQFALHQINPANSNPDKPVFYNCVSGSVLAKLIEHMLTSMGFQDLLLQKEKIEFFDTTTGETHLDGPTMLKLVLSQLIQT